MPYLGSVPAPSSRVRAVSPPTLPSPRTSLLERAHQRTSFSAAPLHLANFLEPPPPDADARHATRSRQILPTAPSPSPVAASTRSDAILNFAWASSSTRPLAFVRRQRALPDRRLFQSRILPRSAGALGLQRRAPSSNRIIARRGHLFFDRRHPSLEHAKRTRASASFASVDLFRPPERGTGARGENRG